MNWPSSFVNKVVCADALDGLRQIPDGVIQCCITSPPYWSLRDYGLEPIVWGGDSGCRHEWGDTRLLTKGGKGQQGGLKGNIHIEETWDTSQTLVQGQFCSLCSAWRGNLGLEPTPELYVQHLVEVFREVRRVLRDDGTLFLNLGDSYFSDTDKSRPCFLPNKADGLSLSRENAAWLAALIEGEGCIQIHQQKRRDSADSFQVDISVGMMVPGMVQKACEITRIGSCRQQNRDVWDWSVRGQQAGELLWQIYPWLVIKRKQAAAAIMLAEDLAARKFGRGNPATKEVLRWRGQLKQAVSDLNQRRLTDFYIAEPSQYNPSNLKPKDLCGIPWSVAFALRDDGWWLRQDIIWAKGCSGEYRGGSVMPESVEDRCTKSHEYLFLLSKSANCYYDHEAIKEDSIDPESISGRRPHNPRQADQSGDKLLVQNIWKVKDPISKRNRRSVWVINPEPTPYAHFATFPQRLVEPCIMAGTSEKGNCGKCGKPWVRVVEKQGLEIIDQTHKDVRFMNNAAGAIIGGKDKYLSGRTFRTFKEKHPNKTTGWQPSCSCGADPVPPIVLDPFSGSGTVGVVAKRLLRNYVLIDLSAEYNEKIAKPRLAQGEMQLK